MTASARWSQFPPCLHGNFRRLSSARGTEIASNRAGASTCCRAATHLAQDGEAQVRQEGGEKGAATGDGQLRLHVLPSHRLHPHHHVSLPAPREPAPRARRRLLACAQGTLCAAAPARHDWPLRRSVLPVPCVGMPAAVSASPPDEPSRRTQQQEGQDRDGALLAVQRGLEHDDLRTLRAHRRLLRVGRCCRGGQR